jgi:hypothetical protein
MIPTEFEQIVQNVQYHTERLQHYALQMRNYKPVSLEIKVSRDYNDGQVAHQHVEPKTVSEKFLASITMGEQLTSTLNTVDEKPMSKNVLTLHCVTTSPPRGHACSRPTMNHLPRRSTVDHPLHRRIDRHLAMCETLNRLAKSLSWTCSCAKPPAATTGG